MRLMITNMDGVFGNPLYSIPSSRRPQWILRCRGACLSREHLSLPRYDDGRCLSRRNRSFRTVSGGGRCQLTVFPVAGVAISPLCVRWPRRGRRRSAPAAARPLGGCSDRPHCAHSTRVCAGRTTPASEVPTPHRSARRCLGVRDEPPPSRPTLDTPVCPVPETGGCHARRRLLR